MGTPLVLIIGSLLGYALGIVSGEALSENVEALGENGALVAFAATLAITPIITVTGRRVRRLRKWFGLLTFVYGSLDGIRFFVLRGFAAAFSEPFLVLGVITLVLLIPLGLTSNRWSIRKLGSRWRSLHKLTYLAAAALLLHIALIPGEPTEIIVPLLLFGPSLVLRLPPVRDYFRSRRQARDRSLGATTATTTPA